MLSLLKFNNFYFDFMFDSIFISIRFTNSLLILKKITSLNFQSKFFQNIIFFLDDEIKI
jgi:hypothetical protein